MEHKSERAGSLNHRLENCPVMNTQWSVREVGVNLYCVEPDIWGFVWFINVDTSTTVLQLARQLVPLEDIIFGS